MVGVESLRIQIVDIFKEEDNIVFEKTEYQNPRLVYNGDESKINHLHTSELSFNVLVDSSVEAVFLHLLSPTERRFKVFLDDVTDAQNVKRLWSGFLLPDQFKEPFIHSNYFVEFLATDGIGLLKNVNLNQDYYSNNKSILEVISHCLFLTGLELPILFALAIDNAGFSLSYLDLFVNTQSYIDGETKKNAYDILVVCLESIGCKLFQHKDSWVIIGLNRLNHDTVSFKKYIINSSKDLEFIETVELARNIIKKPFFDVPLISVESALSKVSVVWDPDNLETLIPEDAASHLPVYIETDPDDTTAKYWNMVTDKGASVFVFYYSNIDSPQEVGPYYNGYIATPNKEIDNSFSYSSFQGDPILAISGGDSAIAFLDLPNNYITLSDAFFVKGSADLERYATLFIEFQSGIGALQEDLSNYFKNEGVFNGLGDNGSGGTRVTSSAHGLETGDVIVVTSTINYLGEWVVTKIDANNFDIATAYVSNDSGVWKINPFKNIFHFAITYKEHLTSDTEEIYLSNFETAGVPNGMFDFNFSLSNNILKGSLNLEKILLLNDGYYNLRIYVPVTHSLLSATNISMFISGLSFTLNTDSDSSTKSEIDKNSSSVNSLELEVFHSDSESKLSKRSFLFSDTIQAQADAGTLVPLESELIPESYSIEDVNSDGVLWYQKIVVVISKSDFLKLQDGYNLFILKDGAVEQVQIAKNTYNVSYDEAIGGYIILQLSYAFSPLTLIIEQSDTLFLKIDASSVNTINYPEHWLTRWKRFNVDESQSFLSLLAKIYMGMLNRYNFIVDGEIAALLTPFDLVEFNYKGFRRYNPNRIELNLNKGASNVFLIESFYENYEEESADDGLGDDVPVVVTPTIVIESYVSEPSLFVYVYSINTSFMVTGIDPINAILTAKQYTDSIANGGVATGFVKTASITSASGVLDFIFNTTELDQQRGWYQVQMQQNNVLSNLVELEVAPLVVEPLERIGISKIDIGDIFNKTVRYSVSYVGFTPSIVKQSVQTVDTTTQLPVGSVVLTTVDKNASELDIVFTESGSYVVSLSADGYTSNSLGWLTIII